MATRNRGKQISAVVRPRTKKQIAKEARALANLQYGETSRALQGNLRETRQLGKNTNAWFRQYQKGMRGLQRGQLAGTRWLQRQMRKNANVLNAQSAQTTAGVDAGAERSAAIRGAETGNVSADARAAAAQRQALLGSTRSRAAQIGASGVNRLAGVTAAAQLGRQADQRRIRGEVLETRSKLRDLKRDKGAAFVKNVGDLTRAERDQDIQRRTLNANIADDRADNALARREENRLANGGSGGSGGGSGGGGYKGGEIRSAVGQLRIQLVEGGISPRSPQQLRQRRQSIMDDLTSPPNALDTRLAQIAYRQVLNRAIRWDRNPNNVGSSAWKEKQRERQGS